MPASSAAFRLRHVRRGDPIAGGRPTAYACLGPQRSLPVTEPKALVEVLRQQRKAAPNLIGRRIDTEDGSVHSIG